MSWTTDGRTVDKLRWITCWAAPSAANSKLPEGCLIEFSLRLCMRPAKSWRAMEGPTTTDWNTTQLDRRLESYVMPSYIVHGPNTMMDGTTQVQPTFAQQKSFFRQPAGSDNFVSWGNVYIKLCPSGFSGPYCSPLFKHSHTWILISL